MYKSTKSNNLISKWAIRTIAAAIGTVSLGAPPLFAAPPSATQPATRAKDLIVDGVDAEGQLHVFAGKSAVLTSKRKIARYSLTPLEVADVNAVAPDSLLLTAKKGGNAQLIVWDENQHAQMIDVIIDVDLPALQNQYKAIFPMSKIEVSSANGAVVLRGRVPSLTAAEQVTEMAKPYGSKVMNFLEIAGGQQISLQVRFAEVSRSAVSALGVNGLIGKGSTEFGNNVGQVNPINDLTGASPAVNSAVTLFGGGNIGSTKINVFVNALRQNNLLRVLAEPNLVAISGQEASFLAGGSFPIPVTQGGGSGSTSVTVEFRDFGVKLMFVPVALGDGRIRLKVAPEVSDLDLTTAVHFNGFVIPGLTQRKVTTTVELAEGQTFAIAGLLNSNVSATKDVTPILGDMPVIGALFRSVRYQRKETELIVLVTPRLVEAMNPDQVPALPGEQWRNPNESDLFLKQDIGGPAADMKHAPAPGSPAGPAPRFYGSYGFVPATQPKPAN